MASPNITARYSRWLGVIVALQLLTLIGQWIGPVGSATPALAQIPDSGAQRNQIIDQLRGTNERLDKLITLLSSGEVQVKLAKPDDNKGR